MGIAFFLIALIPFLVLPSVIAGAFVACFMIYFREVTQIQMKSFEPDFRHGWDFRNWSKSKNMETWIPIGVIMLSGIALHLIMV